MNAAAGNTVRNAMPVQPLEREASASSILRASPGDSFWALRPEQEVRVKLLALPGPYTARASPVSAAANALAAAAAGPGAGGHALSVVQESLTAVSAASGTLGGTSSMSGSAAAPSAETGRSSAGAAAAAEVNGGSGDGSGAAMPMLRPGKLEIPGGEEDGGLPQPAAAMEQKVCRVGDQDMHVWANPCLYWGVLG